MDHLQAMRVFERVAATGGFAAAGRVLDMSPPVVTRMVAELESHLGARLFQRTTRRVSLTEAGEAYLGRVRQILQDVSEADAIASAHTSDLSGRLRVHTEPVLASYVIAPILSEFRQRFPGILVDIEVGTQRSPPIEDFDITLLGADISFNGEIIARRVVESDVVLVAAPNYLIRKGMPEKPEDLTQHDCLRLQRADRPSRVWRLWQASDTQHPVVVEVEPVIIANHTDTLLRAALDGAGITSISVDIVAPYLTRGELIRVIPPWITGRLAMYAALPSRKFIPRRSQVFLEYLIEHTRMQNDEALRLMRA
jgi:DNA-binding transcriptional LysR family regulator